MIDGEKLRRAKVQLASHMDREGEATARAWARLPDDVRELMAGAYIRGLMDAADLARGFETGDGQAIAVTIDHSLPPCHSSHPNSPAGKLSASGPGSATKSAGDAAKE